MKNCLNKRNCRIWDSENPNVGVEPLWDVACKEKMFLDFFALKMMRHS